MPTILYVTAEDATWWSQTSAKGPWTALPGPILGPVSVVTELTEETLLEISVPRVFGSDRSKFVARQLANRFPDTRFRAALPPQPTGGLMDRLAPPQQVLVAVDPPDRLQAALSQVQGPLAGVWSTSLLLTQLAKRHALPATLLMVLSHANTTRIVFLKNHAPLLTRLVAANDTAADQAAEVLRTIRHLENTRVIERGTQRLTALLMGTGKGLAAILSADRVDAWPLPSKWSGHTETDWRGVLFDLARHQPPGQLAPLALRTTFAAQRLEKSARIAIGVCLAATVAAGSGSVLALLQDRNTKTLLNANSQALAVQIAEVEAIITAFGVSPELLRRALALDHDEITTAPSIAAQLTEVSRAFSPIAGARIKNLQWQLLPASATSSACPSDASAQTAIATPAAAPTPPVDAAAAPVRQVELKMTVTLGPDAGPRLRLQQATRITENLRALPGVSVLQDPALNLRDGDLSSGGAGRAEPERTLQWCLVLPGNAPHPDGEKGAP